MNIGNEDRRVDLVNLNEYTVNLFKATREFIARKNDKIRVLQLGRYIDSSPNINNFHKKWVPFANEICKCCTSHNGQRIFGRNLQVHFKSSTHVSTLYKVDRKKLQQCVFFCELMPLSDKNERNLAITNMESR